MSALRGNIVANLVGRVWMTVLGFALIPVYLKFLGMEAYGLVGFFATLQAVLGLLDLGLGATINREMARLSATGDRRSDQRTLLRTLEACYWTISIASGLFVILLAPLIARDWVNATSLSPATVERAVRLMGFTLALQFPFSFYQSALLGLQRQVTMNAIVVTAATVRGGVTAWILWRVSPTVEAYFACQLAVSLAQIAVSFGTVWRMLGGALATRPVVSGLREVWRYAAATSLSSVLGVGLSQTDKLILSGLLSLEQFGYYALAGTVASFVWAVAIPVNQALFPRFAQLLELHDHTAVTRLYHRASQVMVVALVPASATMILFAWPLIFLWTRNARTADQTALVAALLVAGTTLNAIASIATYFQSAAGWPALMLYTNLASVILLVPAIVVVAPQYGPVGAACVWLALNAGYLFVNVPVMHRRLLRGEMWRWYRVDLSHPALGAIAVVAAARTLVPLPTTRLGVAILLSGIGMSAVFAALLLSSELRPRLLRRVVSA